MRTAKLVESYCDRKAEGESTIKMMHRFQAALRLGGENYEDYSVKLTVKEFKDGTLALDDKSPIKLYHHRLEKRMPAGHSVASEVDSGRQQPSASIDRYTLRQLLEDVNDSGGNLFFQPAFQFDQIGKGNLLYRDNKKSRDWARTSGLQLPGANSRTSSARQRIYTEADQVKLRERNSTWCKRQNAAIINYIQSL
jgi:hypothetical protein